MCAAEAVRAAFAAVVCLAAAGRCPAMSALATAVLDWRPPMRALAALRAAVVAVVCLAAATAFAGGREAAVATAHPGATDAAFEVLEQGGNAFDAAVAAAAALAVVEPYSSGLGGGGFWLLHRAADDKTVMLDGRERAPLDAHRDLYLDDDGNIIPGASIDGALAAGIPGLAAALEHLARDYGRLPLARSLAPAIRLARDGFEVDDAYRAMARRRLDALRASPAAASVFLHDGQVPPPRHRVVQPDLAATLELMARHGAAGFYKGALAARLVEGVRRAGGIWRLDDLAQYRVAEREPVRISYRGAEIVSAAPPSSGGLVMGIVFNLFGRFDLAAMKEADRVHHMAEAMRRAYRDRAEYMGDPDYVDMPVARLLSSEYAASLAASIRPGQATPGAVAPLGGGSNGAGASEGEGATGGQGVGRNAGENGGHGTDGNAGGREGEDTTHYSIMDGDGNRVGATLSINYGFGSGFMVEGTGVLLNDEMDDFVAKPGVPNLYRLVGGEANAIVPGKRMLSSMSPTFVTDSRRTAVIGTPGGSRIITMVLLGILKFLEGGSAAQIVHTPRYHHQYLPDEISYEPGALPPQIVQQLQTFGHHLKPRTERYGNMQVVIHDRRSGAMQAASDPRGVGAARVGDYRR